MSKPGKCEVGRPATTGWLRAKFWLIQRRIHSALQDAHMPLFVDNSPPGSCIFCKLVAKEIPAAIVFEDAQTLAFMDLGQVNPGHVLVASKRHAANLLELTADEAAAVMRTAHHVARAVMASFDPPGLTLLQANGKEGDQTVFHFHMHMVPRHANDGITLSWPRKDPAREVLQAHALRLRQALENSASSGIDPVTQGGPFMHSCRDHRRAER
jgi:histidine triad (HIT) family protein